MQKNKYTKYLTNLHNIMREREKKKKIWWHDQGQYAVSLSHDDL